MFRARLQALVDTSLLEKMHEKALEILNNIGIKVSNRNVLERIEGVKGIRIKHGRAKINSGLVETLVEEYRARLTKGYRKRRGYETNEEEQMRLNVGYPGCTHILDTETDRPRPLTTEDVVDAAKLIDSLYDWGVRGGTPGAPQDVPANLRRILQCKIGYEYSRSASRAPFENYVEAEYIRQMAKAVGQKFYVDVYVVSPLRLEGVSLDRAIPFLEERACDGLSVGSMPLAGANASIYPIGAFTQGIAESLGGYIILHTAYPKIQMDFGVGAFHFDLRHGNIVFGSPEQTLMDLVAISVNRFYGRQRIFGVRSFRTNAKMIDAQAQVEKASCATVGVLTGPGTFINSGVLSLDEIFSPAQLIIDCEIGRYLSKLAGGIALSEDDLEASMVVIERCALKGTFLTDKTTLSEYKRIYWYPDLFDYSLFHISRKDRKTLMEKAKEMVRNKIARHDFQLEEDKKKKLEEIYQKAVRHLGTS